MMKDQTILEKLSVSLFILFLFCLTMFPKLITINLILLTLVWIYEGKFKQKTTLIWDHKLLLLLPIYYLICIGSLLYSENISYGIKKLETMLLLFIFPIIIPSFISLNIKKNSFIFIKAFWLGLTISMLFCLVRAFYLFFYELYCRKYGIELSYYPYTNQLFSSYLSYFMHYGYYAMYVNMGVILLLNCLVNNYSDIKRKLKILYITLLVFFSVFILMLYSKAGIISLFIIYLSFGIYIAVKVKKIKYFLYSIVSALLLGLVLFIFIPNTNTRLNTIIDGLSAQELDPSSTESTQLRIFVWKAANELITSNPILGYGLGDADDVLIHKYEEKGYWGAFEKKLNAHNQFYQSIISVGYIGVIPFLLFFAIYFINGIMSRSLLKILFVVLSLFVFLFESYLQTQAGVFFIAIFSVLFFIMPNKTDHSL